MKKLLITLAIFITSLFFAVGIKAAPSNNPVFATIELVEQLIADASSVLQGQIDGLDTRVTDLENTPTPSPSPSVQKEIKVFDANGIELGIFVNSLGGESDEIFYPPLNRLIIIDKGKLAKTGLRIIYSELNCQGDAYISLVDSHLSEFNNRIFSVESGRYYILEKGTPEAPTLVKSSRDEQPCVNNNDNAPVRLVKEVALPLPDPVPLPIVLKYE